MKSLSLVATLLNLFLSSFAEESQLLRNLEEVAAAPFDGSKLRVATFGASTTWGAGLEDRFSAYPYLLSPNVTNLAIRACGATYPSVCTESLVGDEAIFDLIVLEFVRGDGGLGVLARRLRERFPNAVIVFIFMFNPSQLRILDNHGKTLNWMDKHIELGYENRPITRKGVLDVSAHTSKYFLIQHFKTWHEEHRKLMKEIGGHAVEFGSYDDQSKEWFEKKFLLYTDIVHLNEFGHVFVQHRIMEILNRVRPKPSNLLGTWGQGDSCHMWFRDGKITLQHSDNLFMNEFSTVKYALEVPPEGGDIIVNNPFTDPHKLCISFMTTGPESTIYPDVEVTINDNADKKVLIHPLASDYDYEVHVTKIIPIDYVPHGANILNIKPLASTNPPFRITAILIMGENQAMDLNPAILG